ncbi:MAG: hypothetical protein JEZ09_09055 [Salinivirgaceae bacterium]|nr:hypothetical protein [Salinivirgaceae bacterium]
MKRKFFIVIRIVFVISFFLPFLPGCDDENKASFVNQYMQDSISRNSELQISDDSWNEVKDEVYKTFLHDTLNLFIDQNDSIANSSDSIFKSASTPILNSSLSDSLKNLETSDIVLPPLIEKPLSFIIGLFFINFDDSGYEIVIDNSINKLNVNLLRFSILLLLLTFLNKRLKFIPLLNINIYLNLISYLLIMVFLIVDFEKLLYGFWIFFTCFSILLIDQILLKYKKFFKLK